MLIARTEVDGRPCDVRVRGGHVSEVAPRLAPAPGEEVHDARGGALLPGLHDHHLHLLALAAAACSVRCGPPEVRDATALARALADASVAGGWVRGVGYHESVAGPLDRTRLDALRGDVPVRLQHRGGALWMLNSAAVARLGLDAGADAPGVERDARGRATGRLLRLDAWLRARVGAAPPDLAPVGRALARAGVTGVTDAGVGNDAAALELLAAAQARGALPQAVVAMGVLDLPEPEAPGIARGAHKLVLDERALPDPDALAARVAEAHARGRAVAVHCVTRAELVLAAAAFEAAGVRTGDRLEHAAVAPPEALPWIASLGLTVVTQPGLVLERGDAWLRDVAARERPWLWRCAGWLRAAVPLGGGTDAPFGRADPWQAMRAAVGRRTGSGALLGADERLAPERALALFTTSPGSPGGAPRRVVPDAPADLCLLAAPWAEAREVLSAELVAATFRAGRRVGP